MTTTLGELPETVTPSPADTKLAQESSRKLAKLLGAKKKKELRLRIQSDNEPEAAARSPFWPSASWRTFSPRWPGGMP